MRKFAAEFVKRGLMAAWGGPVVIAIIFAILGANGTIETLTVHEVCLGILSSTVMTFVAGGITAIYQVEQLPLPMAALIQAGVLYLDYLMNGWLQNQMVPILTFTVSFAVGYALIWLVIYQVIKRQTQKLNEKLTAQ